MRCSPSDSVRWERTRRPRSSSPRAEGVRVGVCGEEAVHVVRSFRGAWESWVTWASLVILDLRGRAWRGPTAPRASSSAGDMA